VVFVLTLVQQTKYMHSTKLPRSGLNAKIISGNLARQALVFKPTRIRSRRQPMTMHHDYVSHPVRSLVKVELTELSWISENCDVLQDVLQLLTIKPPRWKIGRENK